MDIEGVLVTLWYADIPYVKDGRSQILASDYKKAVRAVGLTVPSDLRRKAHWIELLGCDEHEFEALLEELQIASSGQARTLPKGAVGRLQRHFAAPGIGRGNVLVAEPADVLKVPPPFRWEAIGQKRVANFLTGEEIEQIHLALELDAKQASDPIWPPGVKSRDGLESAVTRPMTGAGSEPKYPTLELATAALVHSLVHNHPFHNGNKRTAVVSMLVFLDRHNQWLRDSVTKDDLFRWILQVTQHRVLPLGYAYDFVADREVLAIAEWIRRNSRAIARSERPITWRRLRTILQKEYDCEVTGRGTGVAIRRDVVSRGVFGRRKVERRYFQFTPGGDGREVGMGTIKSLRRELQIDEEHGVDSIIFYGDEKSPDEFIEQYRGLLRQLAKV